MFTKDDCLSILVKLGDEGLQTDRYIKKLIIAKEIPLEVLKFISDNKGIEAANFYEMLRKNHNQKKSPLYKNLVQENPDLEHSITTLTCLLTQIVLYSNKLENKDAFIKAVRAEEISRILHNYFTDLAFSSEAIKMLKLIRADILAFEYIAGRRNIA